MRDHVGACRAHGKLRDRLGVATRRDPGFPKMREDARRWRLSVPMDYYRNVRKQFEQAGLSVFLYNVNFNETFTDEERDRTFEAAKELAPRGSALRPC